MRTQRPKAPKITKQLQQGCHDVFTEILNEVKPDLKQQKWNHIDGSHQDLLGKSLAYFPTTPCRDKDYVNAIETLRELAADPRRSRDDVKPPAKPPADAIAKAESQPEMRPVPPNGITGSISTV